MGQRILALDLGTRLGAAWRTEDGSVRTCSLPLGDGPAALVRLERELPTLVALAGADAVAVERDPPPALRKLAAKALMEANRIGIPVLHKVTRARARSTVLHSGSLDRAEAETRGDLGDVARMDDPELDAAVMLLAVEAYQVTSAMVDSVKAEAAARSAEILENLMVSLEPRVTDVRERRAFSYGEAGYVGAHKAKCGRPNHAVLSSHIVDRDWDRGLVQ